MDKLHELYDALFDVSAGIIASGEECVPMVVILSEYGGMAIAPLDLPKERWAEIQEHLLSLDGTAAVGTITEGWAVKVAHDVDVHSVGRPSQHPTRFEVVLFVFTLKDGSRASAICNIERPANVLVKAALELNSRGGHTITGAVLPHSAVEDGVPHH